MVILGQISFGLRDPHSREFNFFGGHEHCPGQAMNINTGEGQGRAARQNLLKLRNGSANKKCQSQNAGLLFKVAGCWLVGEEIGDERGGMHINQVLLFTRLIRWHKSSASFPIIRVAETQTQAGRQTELEPADAKIPAWNNLLLQPVSRMRMKLNWCYT